LRALADAGSLALVVCPAPAMRLPDRDGLLDALMAAADKIIKLPACGVAGLRGAGRDASTLSLEKPVPAPGSPRKATKSA